ncbi:hypothetical protein [Thalassomonas actiniarum]|uniref:Uncharacterized protein n=1 Tax=Thalassomonas actiniarum TaxID=485447 RepID=A0AAF0BYH0_9GAMM|nr:hypothetical protein [Thalassomonas actiniarum]WDD97446.1 hypothetical protein SG35_019270 [Thalassomonas actiniarum]
MDWNKLIEQTPKWLIALSFLLLSIFLALLYVGNVSFNYGDGKLGFIKEEIAEVQVVSNGLPIGAIIAWHKGMENSLELGEQWLECDGQTVFDEESPFYKKKVPNLNGEARFLRGSNSSGIMQDHDWKSFSIQNTGPGAYTHEPVTIPKSGINTSFPFGGHWSAPGGLIKVKFDSSEIRPKNMSVVWIIKIKKS